MKIKTTKEIIKDVLQEDYEENNWIEIGKLKTWVAFDDLQQRQFEILCNNLQKLFPIK